MSETVGFTPNPDELTEEQKQILFQRAAYFEVRIEDIERALEYAKRQRKLALIALGML